MNYYSGNVAVRYSELYEYFTFGRDRDLYKDLWTKTYLCQGLSVIMLCNKLLIMRTILVRFSNVDEYILEKSSKHNELLEVIR